MITGEDVYYALVEASGQPGLHWNALPTEDVRVFDSVADILDSKRDRSEDYNEGFDAGQESLREDTSNEIEILERRRDQLKHEIEELNKKLFDETTKRTDGEIERAIKEAS